MRKILLLLSLLAVSSCAQNPVSGRKDFVMMSENQEIVLGRQNDEQVKKQYRVYDSPALQEYVNRIGQKLARQSHRPNLQYHFTVLDSPEINAFALPGGYIYITRGIMAYLNNEAELAAVLGHELGHVTARHGVRQQSATQVANIGLAVASVLIPGMKSKGGQDLGNMVGGAILSGYGRDHELEADRLGAEYLMRSQYDPQAIISVIRVLKNQELMDAEIAKQEGREPRRYHGLFASHPDNDTRLKQAVGEANKKNVAHPLEGRPEFLAMTDGLVFNENVDQGVVRDNRFMHADLGIAVQFPRDWQVRNLPESVVAIANGGQAGIEMTMGEPPQGLSITEYAKRLAGKARVQTIDINGMPAALIESNELLAGVIMFDKQTMIFQLKVNNAPALSSNRASFLNTLNSFRYLNLNERKTLKPLHIRVITAKNGDTFAKLAQRSPLGKQAENYLRIINAQYPNGEPEPGQKIKIVE